MIEFEAFPKLARLFRQIVITEKIDGTNAQIIITNDGEIGAASRTRLITPQDDNFGFASWVENNKEDLLKLGPGRHFGEWWGQGIQRHYDLKERKFSLFNSERWKDPDTRPKCCDVVPVIWYGNFSEESIRWCINDLKEYGSKAAPGFMKPEGVVVYHSALNKSFKITCEKDESPKGVAT